MSHCGLLCRYQSSGDTGDRHPGINAISSHSLGARHHCRISRAGGKREIGRDIVLILVSTCLSHPLQEGKRPRQHEAHGWGHQSHVVLMPETWSSQHKPSPTRGQGNGPRLLGRFERELKPETGMPCSRSLSKPLARPGPELSPERKGAGTLGEGATPTSAPRSFERLEPAFPPPVCSARAPAQQAVA